MAKKILSLILAMALLVMPLAGVNLLTTSAKTFSAAGVTVNIQPFDTVAPTETITVTYTDAVSCDTRLEGVSLGTGTTVSFTPASRSLSDGVYTLIMQRTDTNGVTSYESLTFCVDSNAEVGANDAGVAVSTFAVDALNFTAGYAATSDGTIDLNAVTAYDEAAQYALRYTSDTTGASSVAGIPYQVFDIDLAGKTSGTVAVHYSGATKTGERMIVKVYNPQTAAWDAIGGFIGNGTVSKDIAVATYNDGGKIHVAAMLDYATNGGDTMIWSTDPQHYTKFEDLHDYYYQIYQYAAEQYVDGKVGYIVTTGDLVDDRPTAAVAPHQWDVASTAMSYVEAVGMPNGLVTGNHDVGDYKPTDYSAGANTVSDYGMFYKHFPATRYNQNNWFGGSLNNNVSHYDLVTIGNVDFIVMSLGYGLEATDETIAWANDVLATYSHRTAIITTHQYFDAASAKYAGRAQLIYDKIVDPNPNVKMVICGHDDGSLCIEKTASDGRTVYELLADYQFVEAEDPDFYANEHWIASVPSCCGDGYIRLMTVEGETLRSITYSPVTGRYNPYGDRENLTLDLNCGTPDRSFYTTRFSAAVKGSATTATNVDRMTAYTKNGRTSYAAVTYATVPTAPAVSDEVAWPATATYGAAATPSNPYYAHAAKEAPVVTKKVDILKAAGLGEHPSVTKYTTVGNSSLGLKINLSETPYLYYSFAVPQNGSITFAFFNNSNYSPWLTFMDATKGGTTMNNGVANWDAYGADGAQYFRNSATGCIDMRTLSTDGVNWIVNQLNFYNSVGTAATVSYLFFGSAPAATAWPSVNYGEAATPASPYHQHAAKEAPAVENKVDVLALAGFNGAATIGASATYATSKTIDLEKTPYLYYSFAVPEGGHFTFGFTQNANYAPWLTFLDYETGGTVMASGTDYWNSRNGAQYHLTSATGCIDMRTLTNDPYGKTMAITQLRLYNYREQQPVLSYLFFGSEALGSDAVTAEDTAALNRLLTTARAVDTTLYTAASVTPFKNAITVASLANPSEPAAVMAAYHQLSSAMGALETIKTTIDESTLTSVKNYPMTSANWVCNTTGAALTAAKSFLNVVQHDVGMTLSYSDAATHVWPHARYVGSGVSYTVNPYGGVYAKIDVVCPMSWGINMVVTQDGVTKTMRINVGVENGFSSLDVYGMEGEFSGIYDISDAFIMNGFDPTATFTVSNTYLFVLGGEGSKVRYNHFELMTGKATTANYSKLNSDIAYANAHLQWKYTAASWSAMQTALSNATTKAGTSGLTQPAINLARHKLQKALDALVIAKCVEPYGSLLPEDNGLFIPSTAGAAVAWRNNDGNMIVQNENGTWAQATYTFNNARRVTVRDHALVVDFTTLGGANPMLYVDEQWLSLSQYISDNRNGEDLLAGDYRAIIPFEDIADFGDKATVVVEALRIWSIGEVGNNAVVIREMRIDDYCEHKFDNAMTTYGPAATPTNPYYAHAAKNEPLTAKKVDVLAALGLDHPVINGMTSYGNNILKLTVDLNETPYLYYSVAVPADANFTFAFYNNTTYAPWLTFLDANKGATTMNNGAETWDALNGTQYFNGSLTGCIDMRKLTNDASITDWVISTVTFYNSKHGDATISYMFFGSEALSDGYVEEEEEEEILMGDVDGNGSANTLDAREILYNVLGTTTFTADQIKRADMNGDGVITTADARELLMQIVNAA